jgi:hypothetical protein
MQEIMKQLAPAVIQALSVILVALVTYYVPLLLKAACRKFKIDLTAAQEQQFEDIVVDAIHATEQYYANAYKKDSQNPKSSDKQFTAKIKISNALTDAGLKKSTAQIENKIEAVISRWGLSAKR